MGLGYTGYGRYKEEIDGCLVYEYSGENWNAPFNKGDCLLYDGLISIEKNVLEEEGYVNAIKDGRIKIIKECIYAFYRFKDIKFDYLALRIIIHIFNDYKESREIPQKVSFIQ
ncbi:hypothetical protein [Cytobacillus praedii]|uniref:hypothetical protein n=1 Tax=Cytobacillus praedii TaxID=1742358 RepID=UPI002E22B03E|nr:hypothetical protein [Cytobacillus praedii]